MHTNIHTQKIPKTANEKKHERRKKSNKSKTKPIKNLVNKEEIMITVVWTQNHRII